jgi:hypothetical protein
VTSGMTGTITSITSDPWYYVVFTNGVSGYVHRSYLSIQ